MDIMVAVDPQNPGEELTHALSWATRLGGRVHLRAVLPPSEPSTEARRRLDELADEIADPHRGEAKLLRGSPGRALSEEAAEFDLVLVGTRARTGLGHLFLGSVAERVVRSVEGSVVVCPMGAPPVPTHGPLRVLCPVDAAKPALQAADRVRRWFGHDAELHVVYALADLFASRRVGLVGDITTPEDHPHHGWAMAECRAAIEAADLEVAGLHLILTSSSHPARDLASFQAELGADLVATPTHGRQGVARLQFGSVTERLVRLTSVPSLVVR